MSFRTVFVCPKCGHKFVRLHERDDTITCDECSYVVVYPSLDRASLGHDVGEVDG